MGRIRIGLSSWTDKSLLQSGKFYPPRASDAEGRLRYYASRFPDLVEVNSTYYSLPSERNAFYWNQRTPEDFVFDVKMYGLLTRHPTKPRSLPKDIYRELDEEARSKQRIYLNHVSQETAEEIMARYVSALRLLHDNGKLGAILFQFPRWFYPGRQSLAHIIWCKERVGDYKMAVEFRNNLWMNEENKEDTLGFLTSYGISYVCVDEPQGYKSSVPPIAEVTSPDLSYVRFHGRRQETWEKRGVTVHERTKYLYSEEDMKEWVPKIGNLAERAREVHVLMNTNYEDHAVINAELLKMLLSRGFAFAR